MPMPPFMPFSFRGSVPQLVQPPEQNTVRGYNPINQVQAVDSIQYNSNRATTHREAPHAPSIVLPALIPISDTAISREINASTSQCDALFIARGCLVSKNVQRAEYHCFPTHGLNYYLQSGLSIRVASVMDEVRQIGVKDIPSMAPGKKWSEAELNKYLLMLPRDGNHPLGIESLKTGYADAARHATAWGIFCQFRLLGAITAPSHDLSSATGSASAPPFGGAQAELHHSVGVTEQILVKNLWGKVTDGTKLGFAIMRVYIGAQVNGMASRDQKDWTATPLFVPVTFQGNAYRIERRSYLGHGDAVESAPVIYMGEVRLLNSGCTSTPAVRRRAAGLPDDNGIAPTLAEAFDAANGLDTLQIHRSPDAGNGLQVFW